MGLTNKSGVTTGFGGSADSRTKEMGKLQVALLQLVQSGVLLESDKTDGPQIAPGLTESYAVPAEWVRATMLVRCNATARGHSAVTLKVLEAILRLLRHNIIPVIPLRGTISASGDLMPLAYIAGLLEGNPDVVARMPDGSFAKADEALAKAGLQKTIFGPKEALGLVNGTAASAAIGSLVMYEAHQLATLSQAFTAMAVEALEGNGESFHPFIAAVRPHTGQIEAAGNILSFLQGSSFAAGVTSQKNYNPSGLAQDRYALRSSPQWIGPQLEDLLSAHNQVHTELNSSADNPLVDVEVNEVYYGANFQAAAITSAMEKTRLALQMFGRLYFAQSTELIDPNLNNGLPTNLVADDPSTSFTMKGVDINMAAYMSELAFLTAPVSNHVQPAEMHNQSINSLAFLSSRMTKKAVEIVSLMCASCFYIGCQALDLRALQHNYLSALEIVLQEVNEKTLSPLMTLEEIKVLNNELLPRIINTWKAGSRLDFSERYENITETLVPALLKQLTGHPSRQRIVSQDDFLSNWAKSFKAQAIGTFNRVYQAFKANPNTRDFIGVSSKALYDKIRGDLGVPFHQGLAEHPTAHDHMDGVPQRARRTVGSWISIVFEAVLQGKMNDALYEAIDRRKVDNVNGHGNSLNGSKDYGLNGTNGTHEWAGHNTNATNGHA